MRARKSSNDNMYSFQHHVACSPRCLRNAQFVYTAATWLQNRNTCQRYNSNQQYLFTRPEKNSELRDTRRIHLNSVYEHGDQSTKSLFATTPSVSLSQLGDQNQNSFLPIIRPVRPNSRDDFVDPNSLTRRKRFWRFIGWPQDIMWRRFLGPTP